MAQLELEQKVLLELRPSVPLEQPGLALQGQRPLELAPPGQQEPPSVQPLLAWRLGMPHEAS
jgi:hypothetical protein